MQYIFMKMGIIHSLPDREFVPAATDAKYSSSLQAFLKTGMPVNGDLI